MAIDQTRQEGCAAAVDDSRTVGNNGIDLWPQVIMRRPSTSTSRGAADPISPVQTVQFLKCNRGGFFVVIVVVLCER